MASVYHDEQKTIDGIHIPYAYEFASAVARANAVGLSAADTGKFARQMDDNSIWMLLTHSPILWARVSFDPLHVHDTPTLVAGSGVEIENDIANNQIIIKNIMQAITTLQSGSESLVVPSSGILNLLGTNIGVELLFDAQTETATVSLTLLEHASTHGIGGSDEIAGLLTNEQIMKLDNLPEGADANQNAFSVMAFNGQSIQAKNTTDTVDFAIVGANVVADNTTNTVTLEIPAVSGETGLINHAATHLTGGSDPISLASSTAAGLMSAAYAQKLIGIATGAQVNVVESILGSGHISATQVGKQVTISSSLQQSVALAAGSTGETLVSPLTSGSNLYFKRLVQGDGIVLSADNEKITISTSFQASETLAPHASLHQTGGTDAIPVARGAADPAGALDGLMASTDKDAIESLGDSLVLHRTADEHEQYIHNMSPRQVSARHTYTDGALFQTSTGSNTPVEINLGGTSDAVGAIVVRSTNAASRGDGVIRWGIYAEHASYGAVVGVVPKGVSYAGFHARVNDFSNNNASGYQADIDKTSNAGNLFYGASAGLGSLIKVTGTNAGATHAVNVATAGTGSAAYFTQNGTGRGVTSYVANNGDSAYWAQINAANTNTNACLFYGVQYGLGGGVRSVISNASNAATALYVRHNGIDASWLADLTHSGTGNGVYINVASGRQALRVAQGDVNIVSGNCYVGGTLSKAAGTFLIDHPVDPYNKVLRHSFVESPDMKNIYDGTIKLDEYGTATIYLPEYFSALNSDYRCQLTPLCEAMPNLYAGKVNKDYNTFSILGGEPNGEVSWQITGIRKDKFALANPVVVEEAKEKPGYLHPELFE
jgi:hypothetical protein